MIQCRPYDADQAGAFLTLYRACLTDYDIPPATPEQETRVLGILAS